MKNKNFREQILNESSYWLESINGLFYESILNYMEENELNRTGLSKHLGISKGRVSQILNDGEINFSLDKLIQIAIKIDKFPILNFIDKSDYLKKQLEKDSVREISLNYTEYYSERDSVNNKNVKVISLTPDSKYQHKIIV